MKSIKLTLVTFDSGHGAYPGGNVSKKDSKKPVWINPDNILAVQQMTTPRDTYFRVILKGHYYDVLENPANKARRK